MASIERPAQTGRLEILLCSSRLKSLIGNTESIATNDSIGRRQALIAPTAGRAWRLVSTRVAQLQTKPLLTLGANTHEALATIVHGDVTRRSLWIAWSVEGATRANQRSISPIGVATLLTCITPLTGEPVAVSGSAQAALHSNSVGNIGTAPFVRTARRIHSRHARRLAYTIIADLAGDAWLGNVEVVDTVLSTLEVARRRTEGASPLEMAIGPLWWTVSLYTGSTTVSLLASAHILARPGHMYAKMAWFFTGCSQSTGIAGRPIEGPHVRLRTHVGRHCEIKPGRHHVSNRACIDHGARIQGHRGWIDGPTVHRSSIDLPA